MDDRRFRRLTAAYGSDFGHWPSALRGPAERHLEHSAEAWRALQEARRLDQVLDRATTPEVHGSAMRVLEQLARQRLRAPSAQRSSAPERLAIWLGWDGLAVAGGLWWSPVALCMAMGLLGCIVGTMLHPAAAPPEWGVRLATSVTPGSILLGDLESDYEQ